MNTDRDAGGISRRETNVNGSDKRKVKVVRWEDLEVGRLLGCGSFSAVFDVRLKEEMRLCKQPRLHGEEATGTPTEYNRATTASSTFEASGWCRSSKSGQGDEKLAIKCVSDQTFENQQADVAAEGLRNELKILLSLPNHRHIVELVAMSPDFDLTGLETASLDSFLILHQLSITLDRYLLRVKTRLKLQSPCLMVSGVQQLLPSADKKRSIRIGTIGLAVARALEFLHQHHIIYRDLKPSNIGFDSRHNVRLFDFGLSCMAPPRNGVSGRSESASTFVGTPRYMAPEVRHDPFYDNRGDVYSFGLLLRELYTLKTPPIRRSALWQPHMGISSSKVRNLVKDCTRLSRSQRPSMSLVVAKVNSWNHVEIL